jgi:hypothetical protein
MRYYFHIRDGWTVIADDEGLECASLDAAHVEAQASARDLTGTCRSASSSVQIADRAGNILGSANIPRAA